MSFYIGAVTYPLLPGSYRTLQGRHRNGQVRKIVTPVPCPEEQMETTAYDQTEELRESDDVI